MKAEKLNQLADELELFSGFMAAQAKTKGRETVSEEMMELAFFAESMSVETGRIIPSPALAEAVIGGAAQIIKERDALRAERDAAQADAARHKALWDSVPWDALRAMKRTVQRSGVIDPDDAEDVDIFLAANAPQEPRP
jgi:hypothetical protein